MLCVWNFENIFRGISWLIKNKLYFCDILFQSAILVYQISVRHVFYYTYKTFIVRAEDKF